MSSRGMAPFACGLDPAQDQSALAGERRLRLGANFSAGGEYGILVQLSVMDVVSLCRLAKRRCRWPKKSHGPNSISICSMNF
jgi:hypothetical protein